MAHKLTQIVVVDVLVISLKNHEGYEQRMQGCMAPVVECVSAEYAANIQSAIISALRSESVAKNLACC